MEEKIFNFDNSYLKLQDIFYTPQTPSKVPMPKLVLLNEDLAKDIGLDLKLLDSEDALEIFAGNKKPKDTITIAQGYCGHQFGHFTTLGDGRAILLGEHITEEGKRFDIQLKGSGRTVYSRGGDGKATLGPMLREYIISEAMYGLGIETTRSLAVVTTGEDIFRDMILPGAVLTRVAKSHIRVGTFQFASAKGEYEDIKALADYTINRHYSYLNNDENKYLSFLKEVIKKQAILIAKWQLVGFIHGVMNTDNMTISGETIDYGPCAFMDTYNIETVFSSIDVFGRYAYGNQPDIGGWNLARFAETLVPLLDDNREKAIELAQEAIGEYASMNYNYWFEGMKKKLGLIKEEKQDKYLIEAILSIMQKYKADYTNTFKALTLSKYEENEFFNSKEFKEWNTLWQQRLSIEDNEIDSIKELMKNNNPAVIPRNHRVEEALEWAVRQDDYTKVKSLLEVLKNPYEYSLEQEEYSKLPDKINKNYRTFCGT